MRYLILLLPLLVLVGCASISKEECTAGDWVSVGFRDGSAGRSIDFLSNHAKACAEVGVTPNRSQWEQGRAQGLLRYCTPQNAYTLGKNGASVNNVCPAQQVRGLSRANAWGREYFNIGREISDLRNERDDLRRVLAAMTGELTPEQAALQRTYRQRLNRVNDRLFDLSIEQRRYSTLPQSLIADL
jgi:hypothetical protein